MKTLKTIGYLFLYPVLLLGTGFLGGALFVSYYYPASFVRIEATEETSEVRTMTEPVAEREESPISAAELVVLGSDEQVASEEKNTLREVTGMEDTLNADTTYILEETDLRSQSVVETRWSLPNKYIGMDRQEFLDAMEIYEAAPPLQELERGFVSLEVLSFSEEEVVVQMNYEYVQPSNVFYLMVRNNYVVVCLEDMQTVYMETGILLKELPEEIQQDIIQVMFIPDEEKLYDFLENYSS